MNLSRCGRAFLPGLCGILLVSCGKTDASRSPARREIAPRPVRVVRAEMRPMERAISVTGTLAAQEQSTLSAKVAGRLQHMAVDIGSVVRAGDVLAQVEPRDYELGVQQAAAALAQARTSLGLPLEGEDDHIEIEQVSTVKQARAVFGEAAKNRERVRNLSQSGIASQSELDTVEASHTVAVARYETALEEARTRRAALVQRRAEYELARKQLADTSVCAPFDGAVQARPASLGEYVAVGTPVVKLVKADPLRLRLEVSERESGLVRTGQLVRLLVEGDTNTYSGRIARLSPALNEQSRVLLVEADVPRQGSLRPGLFARSRIVVNEREDGVSVPVSSIITFAGLEKVVLVQEGKAVERLVTTGRREADWTEIVSGLDAGEIVVVEPAGLRTGQPVSLDGGARSQAAVRTEKPAAP